MIVGLEIPVTADGVIPVNAIRIPVIRHAAVIPVHAIPAIRHAVVIPAIRHAVAIQSVIQHAGVIHVPLAVSLIPAQIQTAPATTSANVPGARTPTARTTTSATASAVHLNAIRCVRTTTPTAMMSVPSTTHAIQMQTATIPVPAAIWIPATLIVAEEIPATAVGATHANAVGKTPASASQRTAPDQGAGQSAFRRKLAT